jgi:hypothetical protein
VVLTDLTGASLLWDLPHVICLIRVSFGRIAAGQFFFLAGCVLGVFLFQSLEKSLRLPGMFVVRLL